MVFIPHGTDAPIYHPPIATLTIVVLNVLLFFATPFVHHFQEFDQAHRRLGHTIADWTFEGGGYDGPDAYKLQYGVGLKPWQGITSTFLHANMIHLLINMVFLWMFGMIVEGKIGWPRFLAIYFGIALLRGILAQLFCIIFLPNLHTASMGASSVVFGLMGIALVWAPLNTIQVTFAGNRYRTQQEVSEVDVPIYGFAGCFLLIEVIYTLAMLQRHGIIAPTAHTLHLLGTILGLAIGVVMVKRNWVDCEHYDIFSVWAGRHTMKPEERDPEGVARKQAKVVEQGVKQIREILAAGDNPQLAYRAHISMREKYASWSLPEKEFLIIIKQLCDQQYENDAVAAMEEYLKAGRPKQNQVRLKLASMLVGSMAQPGQALRTLVAINYDKLSHRERQIYDDISAKAKARRMNNAAANELEF
ncbi:rhomboid family intramembrane serine protease [Bremerella sp. JC817]|uniref:rhomboid family intramembrane serine protease n=1 Tax=Bremerella sp. JC817 TaxID=3231756 RepID=UPI00345787ED